MKNRRLTVLKPRNPFVAAARFRHAGAFVRSDATRQAARQRLRKELHLLKLDT